MSTLFVYAKDDKIKVLNTEVAIDSNDRLLKQGWKHTATIDACRWLENIYNDLDEEDAITEIRQLASDL